MNTKPTFEELPEAIEKVLIKLDDLTARFDRQDCLNKSIQRQYLDLDDLLSYLPGSPAKQTIYGKIHRREIPFCKQHGRLYFVKEDIDKWLNEGRKKTKYEIYNSERTTIGRRI
jgi:hypothetical protein